MGLDVTAIVLKLIEVSPRLLPRPKPPKIDYKPLFEALPRVELVEAPVTETSSSVEIERVPLKTQPEESKVTVEQDVATSCISCSRSHLSTVSGALGEALRFAREGGIKDPEAQRRLMLSEDEINIMERIDLASDALQRAPEEEQKLAFEFLPRIRTLRQDIGNVASIDELERIAGEASILGQEFRLRHLQLKGVDLNPVMELARKVQEGELTMDEAKEQLKEILPEEE